MDACMEMSTYLGDYGKCKRKVISLLLLFLGCSRATQLNCLILPLEEFLQMLSPVQVLGYL